MLETIIGTTEKEKSHKWAEVQAAFKEGKTIQIKGREWGEWMDCPTADKPYWNNDNYEFRVKPMKHKWAKEIKAWADGEEIEFKFPDATEWRSSKYPSWDLACEFRVKPKSEPLYYRVARGYDKHGEPYLICFTKKSGVFFPPNFEWVTDWIEVP